MGTFFRIENGEIINNRKGIARAFKLLKDGTWEMDFKWAKKRSNQQNRFLWLLYNDYVQPGLYNNGFREIRTAEDAHEFCKNYVYPKKQIVNEVTGEVKEMVVSSREWSTIQAKENLEILNQFCSEYLGFALPDPESQLTIFA